MSLLNIILKYGAIMVQLKDESYDQFKNSDKQPLPSFHKAVFIGGVSLRSNTADLSTCPT